MNFAPSNFVSKPQIKAPSSNLNIWLSSLALLIVFAIAIYLAAQGPGTSPEELAARLSALP